MDEVLNRYFQAAHALNRLRTGLVGPYIEAFAIRLETMGYKRRTIRDRLATVGHFNLWAEGRCDSIAKVDEALIDAFGTHLGSCRCIQRNKGKYTNALGPVRLFLSFLREEGIVGRARSVTESSAEQPLLTAFCRFMSEHRGLAQSTIDLYSPIISELLDSVAGDPSRLDARGLRAFVLDRASRYSKSRVRQITSGLRAFMRFLIAEGRCPPELESAVPTVAQWRLSALPRYLPASDVERVIGACATCTAIGRRDRAIVLLLARLGLRAGDVIALRLSDVDWREATLLVSGKARLEARLPLTQEVGDAILAYLEGGRPPADTEIVFLRATAPIRPLAHSSVVSCIAARAIRRAGVVSPSYGAHVFRHSAATAMLRQGASLQEIGAVLRHSSFESTAHYAKVDVHLLQEVAQPWPEVSSC